MFINFVSNLYLFAADFNQLPNSLNSSRSSPHYKPDNSFDGRLPYALNASWMSDSHDPQNRHDEPENSRNYTRASLNESEQSDVSFETSYGSHDGQRIPPNCTRRDYKGTRQQIIASELQALGYRECTVTKVDVSGSFQQGAFIVENGEAMHPLFVKVLEDNSDNQVLIQSADSRLLPHDFFITDNIAYMCAFQINHRITEIGKSCNYAPILHRFWANGNFYEIYPYVHAERLEEIMFQIMLNPEDGPYRMDNVARAGGTLAQFNILYDTMFDPHVGNILVQPGRAVIIDCHPLPEHKKQRPVSDIASFLEHLRNYLTTNCRINLDATIDCTPDLEKSEKEEIKEAIKIHIHYNYGKMVRVFCNAYEETIRQQRPDLLNHPFFATRRYGESLIRILNMDRNLGCHFNDSDIARRTGVQLETFIRSNNKPDTSYEDELDLEGPTSPISGAPCAPRFGGTDFECGSPPVSPISGAPCAPRFGGADFELGSPPVSPISGASCLRQPTFDEPSFLSERI